MTGLDERTISVHGQRGVSGALEQALTVPEPAHADFGDAQAGGDAAAGAASGVDQRLAEFAARDGDLELGRGGLDPLDELRRALRSR